MIETNNWGIVGILVGFYTLVVIGYQALNRLLMKLELRFYEEMERRREEK